MADEQQALRSALVLIGQGILTPRAGRAMAYFNEHGMFCQALKTPDGDTGIVFRDFWYTPAEFNALVEEGGPTPADATEPAPDGDEPEPAQQDDDTLPPPSPDDVVRELRVDANAAKLEEIHEASSQHTDGEGGLVWGLAIGLGALLLFVIVMIWAFFHGVWR